MIRRQFVAKYRSRKKRNAMKNELLQALSYTKNLVIIGRGQNMSVEVLMEELAELSILLKPAFQDMGHYLHICDKASAETVLHEYMNTGFSKDVGRFYAGWEDIAADELFTTIEIYLNSLREEQLYYREQKEEIFSDLIYFPVVLNAMAVLLNFIYVAFFLEQQSMFNQIF